MQSPVWELRDSTSERKPTACRRCLHHLVLRCCRKRTVCWGARRLRGAKAIVQTVLLLLLTAKQEYRSRLKVNVVPYRSRASHRPWRGCACCIAKELVSIESIRVLQEKVFKDSTHQISTCYRECVRRVSKRNIRLFHIHCVWLSGPRAALGEASSGGAFTCSWQLLLLYSCSMLITCRCIGSMAWCLTLLGGRGER